MEEDASLSSRAVSDANEALPPPAASVSAPASTAAKASSAALSLAAAAKSKLTQGGRRIISPLAHVASGGGSSRGMKANASPSTSAATTTSSSASTSFPEATGDDSAMGAAYLAAGISSSLASATSSLATASSSISNMLFSTPTSTTNSASGVAPSSGNGGSLVMDPDVASEQAAAAKEEFRQVSAQQRMRILEDLVQHRRSDWNYLKLMHEGSNYWLNVALLREQQVMAHLGQKQTIRRGVQFFYLGLGLGRIINESAHPQTLAMDCCQLLEELEFYFSSATVQGMKMMVATSSTLHEPVEMQDNALRYSVDEPFRPTLYKWNQRPVFRRLMAPPIPFPLDYREVLLSLCDILAIIYSKLVEDNSSSENVNIFLAIIRFDERIKKLFIDPVKKEFSAVALQVISEEMTSVRKAYASRTSSTPAPITGDAVSPTPATADS